MNWPISIRQLDDYKYQYRLSNPTKLSNQRWQGQGVREFANDTLTNQWLWRGDLLKQSRVIDAIKLRTNTYPTQALRHIIEGRVDPSCRRCRRGSETLGHILGRCAVTKNKRILRHNEIFRLLRDRLTVSNMVMEEPQVVVEGQIFKPDLIVLTNRGRVKCWM